MRFLLGCLALIVTGSALAHPGHITGSFLEGFWHPFSGLDHLIAILLAGLISSQHKPQDRYKLPLIFMACMLLGWFFCHFGWKISWVEVGIQASIYVFAVMVLLRRKLVVWQVSLLLGAFSFFHGHAHAIEATGDSFLYSIGFLLGTSIILLVGLSLGIGISKVLPNALKLTKKKAKLNEC